MNVFDIKKGAYDILFVMNKIINYMIDQRKHKINKLRQIVGHMQQELSTLTSNPPKPPRKREHSKNKSKENKVQTSKKSASKSVNEESEPKSLEKKNVASPQKLA